MRDRKILEALIKKYGKNTILNELDTAMFKRAAEKAEMKGRPIMARRFNQEYDTRRKKEFKEKIINTIGFPRHYTHQFDDENFRLSYIETSNINHPSRIIGVILKHRFDDFEYVWFSDDVYDIGVDVFCREFNIELNTVANAEDSYMVDLEDIVNHLKGYKFKNKANARQFVNLIHRISDENGVTYDPLDWHDFAKL